MKMNVNGNFKDNLMGKKKVIFIGCLIFAVALIAAILHMVSGGGKDSAKNILYADKVSVITGNGSGTVNRFAGVVEAQDTLKISLSEGQKVKEIFVEKGQEVEPGTGVNTEGLHLMTAYIVDADGKEPYVWVANKKDRLEKRNVKLGAYDEEQDTWEITEGLKETDYIVWPDGECKEGAAVQKNENVQAGGMEEGE